MKDFLTTQYEIAERLEEKIIKTNNDQNGSLNRPQARSKNKSNRIFNKIQSFTSEQRKHMSCELCTRGHKLKTCEKFKKLNINERNNFVRSKRLCTNCLSHTHNLKSCKSKFNCLHCHKRHHTMLHYSTYPLSHQKRAHIKKTMGLIAKANPETQNCKNCQETPCCSKAQKAQTLHSETQSGLVTKLVTTIPTQVEKKSNQYLNSQLRKFQEIGKLPRILNKTLENQYCKSYSKAATTRSNNGRYVVQLPLEPQFSNTPQIGIKNKVRVTSDSPYIKSTYSFWPRRMAFANNGKNTMLNKS
ncbi:uncharacterized protein LOC126764134 [Bactrocera neohumeralis]|uniref:uncharacterized protein LOC126764134 n=1 Tax=Bactrocera neohumeralis TaxID=98809 RepID=UPI002165C2F1|nr:uncharacterized protein LOC126764134 [Bactrocera neohumeralis]